jgi:copper transport protein
MSAWRARLGWAAALVAGAVLAVPASAAAHSALLRSDPADGARLDEAPAEVLLEFSEPPDPDLSRVELFDAEGDRLDVGEPTPDPADAAVVRVSLPQLDDGVYTVSWRALSAVDGHVTTGAFSFGVGDVPEHVIQATSVELDEQGGPELTGVVGRWLVYSGLALMLGWAMATLLVFRTPLPGPRVALVGCWLLAAAGLVLITLAEAASVDASVGDLLASSVGDRLLRTGAVLGALGASVAVATYRTGRAAAGLVAALAAAAMYAHVASGHAGAPSPDQWLNLSSQWLHLAAIGTWIGGLAWLLAGTRTRRDDVASIGRFSALATVCVGVVVLTGVVRALDEVGSVDALFDTDYGRTLLLKLGLVASLLALGALNKFWNVPAILRGGRHVERLRRTVRGEVAFAAAVLGVVGVLSSLPPPADMAAHDDGHQPVNTSIEATGSDYATTVRVTLRVEPGVVGENRFEVRIADYDTGETVEAVRVALRFTMPQQPDLGANLLELRPTDDHWAATGTAVAQPGRWQATAIIAFRADGVEIPLRFDVGDAIDEPSMDHGGAG